MLRSSSIQELKEQYGVSTPFCTTDPISATEIHGILDLIEGNASDIQCRTQIEQAVTVFQEAQANNRKRASERKQELEKILRDLNEKDVNNPLKHQLSLIIQNSNQEYAGMLALYKSHMDEYNDLKSKCRHLTNTEEYEGKFQGQEQMTAALTQEVNDLEIRNAAALEHRDELKWELVRLELDTLQRELEAGCASPQAESGSKTESGSNEPSRKWFKRELYQKLKSKVNRMRT